MNLRQCQNEEERIDRRVGDCERSVNPAPIGTNRRDNSASDFRKFSSKDGSQIDFMFGLTRQEGEALLLQNARANLCRSGPRTPPFVFTERGVAMLSCVLNSERAVQMNMAIMCTFVHMRELIAANEDIPACVKRLERGHDRTASVTEVLVDAIARVAHELNDIKAQPPAKKRCIGLVQADDRSRLKLEVTFRDRENNSAYNTSALFCSTFTPTAIVNPVASARLRPVSGAYA